VCVLTEEDIKKWDVAALTEFSGLVSFIMVEG
jgi:hypothetical protein